MEYRLSTHARERIAERRIPDDWLRQVMEQPEQTIPALHNRETRQSVFEDDNGKYWLLRVIIEHDMVITAMLTSKIDKYRGAP